MLAHKVTINLNVFRVLIGYIIVGNVDHTLVIEAERHGVLKVDAHVT